MRAYVLWSIQRRAGVCIRRGNSKIGLRKGFYMACTCFMYFAGCGMNFHKQAETERTEILHFGVFRRLIKKSPLFGRSRNPLRSRKRESTFFVCFLSHRSRTERVAYECPV